MTTTTKYHFFIFLLLTLLLYYPTIHCGFTTDVTGGIERISTRPFKDILISFGFPALNQLSVALFYIQYKIFGTNGIGWYLVYGGLHSFNAFLLFKIFYRLLTTFEIPRAYWIASVGAVFFLISPYQSEVLVWKACQNYLLAVCFIFSCLWYTLVYLKSKRRRDVLKIYGFFLLALFTFEYGLFTPLLLIAFLVIWRLLSVESNYFWADIKMLVLPQFLAVGGYFVLSKLVFGKWIGHYGAATHLSFPIKKMMATGLKFLAKYLFFVRSYPPTYKRTVFNFIDQYAYVLFALFLLLYGFGVVYSIQKNKKPFLLLLLCLALFAIAVAPVSNLYFYYLQQLINDRHGYLASAFLLMGLSLLLFQLPKYLNYSLVIGYACCALFLLVSLNGQWRTSQTLFDSLMKDFRWHDASKVVLLNVPDNYKGIYLFRIIGIGSGFKDALQYVHGDEVKGQFIEVTQYNMATPTDGVRVEKISNSQLKVTFNQWGNWFWRNGIGAGSGYENEYYKVHFKGQFYELTIKEGLEDAVFIYQNSGMWKEFK